MSDHSRNKNTSFAVCVESAHQPPNLPYKKIKEHILGTDYSLSLVFMKDSTSRNFEKKFFKKNKSANVLSFPLSDSSGEIFINLREASREHKKFDRTIEQHVGSLFIHGCFHLKGLSHGSTMEREESNVRRHFDFERLHINDKKHYRRN